MKTLKVEYSRQREEKAQMPWLGSLLGIFKGKLQGTSVTGTRETSSRRYGKSNCVTSCRPLWEEMRLKVMAAFYTEE